MEQFNQPEKRPTEPWPLVVLTLLATLVTAFMALVGGFVLGWIVGNGTNRNSWGDRGDTTFHAILILWLLSCVLIAIYSFDRRKYFSLAGILLGVLSAVYIYFSWPFY